LGEIASAAADGRDGCWPGAALAGIVTDPLTLPVLDEPSRAVSTRST
jgi:hypothetical protein